MKIKKIKEIRAQVVNSFDSLFDKKKQTKQQTENIKLEETISEIEDWYNDVGPIPEK